MQKSTGGGFNQLMGMVAADYHLKHLNQGHAQGQGLGQGLGVGIANGPGIRGGIPPSSSSSSSGFDHADIAAGNISP